MSAAKKTRSRHLPPPQPSELALALHTYAVGWKQGTEAMRNFRAWALVAPGDRGGITYRGQCLLHAWWPDKFGPPLRGTLLVNGIHVHAVHKGTPPEKCMLPWRDPGTASSRGGIGCAQGNHHCVRSDGKCPEEAHKCVCGARLGGSAPSASAMHPDNLESVRNASVANAHAAALGMLDELQRSGPYYGRQRMRVEEAATGQLQGDGMWKEGQCKDLTEISKPLDEAQRLALAKELEMLASQLRHQAPAGQLTYATYEKDQPQVWVGFEDGKRKTVPGPVVEVSISLVVASTFKVGP